MGLFWAKKLDKLCVFPEVVTLVQLRNSMAEIAAVIVGISHNIVSLFNPGSMLVMCFVNAFNSEPVYTRDPHSLFIVPADVLAPRNARPSACTMLSLVTRVCVKVWLLMLFFVICFRTPMTSLVKVAEIWRNIVTFEYKYMN